MPQIDTTLRAPLKLLIIGSLPPPLGGTSVSLQHLVTSLETKEYVEVRVVNTNTIRGSGGLQGLDFLRVLKQIISAVRHVNIITLHVSIHALPLIGPPVLFITRLFKKRLLIRRFGGKNHDELDGFRYFLADLAIRKSDCYLAQTKSMVAHAKQLGIGKTRWFPTSRPVAASQEEPRHRQRCRRFLYLSHIRESKGIREVIAAAQRFQDDIEVNVYGPFYENLDDRIFADCTTPVYHGVLPQEQVHRVLAEHDALLLPTYYPGEGYPGIILEAFSVGIPVIASRWKSIPELVDDSCGLLVEPRDADALYQAMDKLTREDDLFHALCHGASQRHKEFDADLWAERFVEYCRLALGD